MINIFDEESDEASCVAIWIDCEKRFLTKRNSPDIMVPTIQLKFKKLNAVNARNIFLTKKVMKHHVL